MLFTKNQKTYFRSVWLRVSLFCAEEDWGRGWERKRWKQVRVWVCATTRGAYTDPLIGAHSMCEVYSVGLCKPLSLLAGSYNSYYNIIMGYFSIISGLSPLSPDYCSITDKTTVLSSEQLCLALQCQRTYPLCTTFLLHPAYTFIKVLSRSL